MLLTWAAFVGLHSFDKETTYLLTYTHNTYLERCVL